MNSDLKVQENFYRREAKRRGLELKKSRAKKWSINNHQGYQIIDKVWGGIKTGEKFDLTFDDVVVYFHDLAIALHGRKEMSRRTEQLNKRRDEEIQKILNKKIN